MNLALLAFLVAVKIQILSPSLVDAGLTTLRSYSVDLFSTGTSPAGRHSQSEDVASRGYVARLVGLHTRHNVFSMIVVCRFTHMCISLPATKIITRCPH